MLRYTAGQSMDPQRAGERNEFIGRERFRPLRGVETDGGGHLGDPIDPDAILGCGAEDLLQLLAPPAKRDTGQRAKRALVLRRDGRRPVWQDPENGRVHSGRGPERSAADIEEAPCRGHGAHADRERAIGLFAGIGKDTVSHFSLHHDDDERGSRPWLEQVEKERRRDVVRDIADDLQPRDVLSDIVQRHVEDVSVYDVDARHTAQLVLERTGEALIQLDGDEAPDGAGDMA